MEPQTDKPQQESNHNQSIPGCQVVYADNITSNVNTPTAMLATDLARLLESKHENGNKQYKHQLQHDKDNIIESFGGVHQLLQLYLTNTIDVDVVTKLHLLLTSGIAPSDNDNQQNQVIPLEKPEFNTKKNILFPLCLRSAICVQWKSSQLMHVTMCIFVFSNQGKKRIGFMIEYSSIHSSLLFAGKLNMLQLKIEHGIINPTEQDTLPLLLHMIHMIFTIIEAG
eukprot:935295_1